jgi:hypothetical protein
MKIKVISEVIAAVVIGVLSGLSMNGMHLKWHRLGREAFLIHESQNFDKLYANPSSLTHLILLGVIMTLTFIALYKGIALVAAKVLSTITDKSETVQG